MNPFKDDHPPPCEPDTAPFASLEGSQHLSGSGKSEDDARTKEPAFHSSSDLLHMFKAYYRLDERQSGKDRGKEDPDGQQTPILPAGRSRDCTDIDGESFDVDRFLSSFLEKSSLKELHGLRGQLDKGTKHTCSMHILAARVFVVYPLKSLSIL